MDILFCTDHNYIMPTFVAMLSASSSNVGETVRFHVLADRSVGEADKQRLKAATESNAQHSVTVYNVDSQAFTPPIALTSV